MKENNILKILIAILIILNLIMCFKGLKLETENREMKEKIENFEVMNSGRISQNRNII